MGQEVLIVESASGFGEGVSSRNSEVIHAGIYYAAASLKAKLCVRGKALLYPFCESHGVSHRRIGKMIVATNAGEEEQLESIRQRAEANGVRDLHWLGSEEIRRLEPMLDVVSALWSPSTGIISAHGLMTALLGDVERHGGVLATQCRVVKVEALDKGFNVHCNIEGQAYDFHCLRLVNAAGLGAQAVARNIEGMPSSLCPPLVLCKGNYFVYEGAAPFKHLIYPVPEKDGAGLGVHATIDLGGQVRFGPDVEYVFDESYDVSMLRLALSIAAIKRYFPGLDERRLSPGYSGIRPKIVAQGEAAADFMIQGEDEHGLPGLVNLFGIESPGLTASLAIAEFVSERLQAGS